MTKKQGDHSALTVRKIIAEAMAIEESAARDAGALGFMARAMVQATLPHRNVPGGIFERKNGAFTLTLMAPPKIGLPYGTVPRLMLAWLSTEAVRTRSRELELGSSMSSFMAQLGLPSTGGPRGGITRLKTQATRLFSTTISAVYDTGDQTMIVNRPIASEAMLWWHAKDPGQGSLWGSTVKLSEEFFRELIEHPVPVDMRALKALKRSPMAIDIYCWLTYRASYATRPSAIPWEALALQFGADYRRVRDFKGAFVHELDKVHAQFPGARFDLGEGGLIVKPSRPHIARKGAP